MTVKELKELLDNTPSDYVVCVMDINTYDTAVAHSAESDSWNKTTTIYFEF